ncbi:MAG: entericidin A/B family lipoprotein [Betaproteobacteria bacterium]|nr:entericidin A/B family lipoprotein [Betaproteobacteria bacterium]
MIWKRFALSSSIILLTACNTINGIGKDLEKAGEVVQKSSK